MISEPIINSCYRKYDKIRTNEVDYKITEDNISEIFHKLFYSLNKDQKDLLNQLNDNWSKSQFKEEFLYFSKGLEIGIKLEEINKLVGVNEIEKIFNL